MNFKCPGLDRVFNPGPGTVAARPAEEPEGRLGPANLRRTDETRISDQASTTWLYAAEDPREQGGIFTRSTSELSA
jgi:hypothetical protein